MSNYSTFVGMDVHKKFIQAHVHSPETGEVLDMRMDNDVAGIKKLVKKVRKIATGEVLFCYEAGLCGFAISRRIQELGLECQVIAPSLIPIKPGDRIKNDRLDAIKLAQYLQRGLLTEVHQPTPADEAVRNLCRARLQEVNQLTRCRHWILKFCTRQGLLFPGKSHWSDRHHAWLGGVKFTEEFDQDVFDNYLLCMSQTQERIKAIEEKIHKAAGLPRFKVAVDYLNCFRGIKEITAMTLVSEIQDIERFASARQLMGYAGITSGEHSSGETKITGGITRMGNSHIRRVLIEVAWHCRLRPRLSKEVAKRREGKPAQIKALADKAQHRLYKKFWLMTNKGKSKNKVVTAAAREMLGFVWAALKMAKNKETPNISPGSATTSEKVDEPVSGSMLPQPPRRGRPPGSSQKVIKTTNQGREKKSASQANSKTGLSRKEKKKLGPGRRTAPT